MTLTEFLLARIAEDEAAAERAGSFTPWSETFRNDNYGHLTIQPARVLAECEAKRQIVDLHNGASGVDVCDAHDGATLESVDCDTLRLLTLPYANHPDYDETWRP